MQCYSGIAPVTEASGNSQWVHFRFLCPVSAPTFHEFALFHPAPSGPCHYDLTCATIRTSRTMWQSAPGL